jgi:hypothetical protein
MPAALAVPLLTTAAGFAANAVSKKNGGGGSTGSGPSILGPVISAGVNAGASIYGAHKQGQANSKALTFEREQAQQAAQDAEIARRANYDQWKARQQRLNTITGVLGWGSQNIPAYVPGQVPNYMPGAQSRRDQVFATSGFGGPYRPGTIGSYLGG